VNQSLLQITIQSCTVVARKNHFFPSKEISGVESIMKQQPEEEFVSGLT
jgi:hypothetical protein